MQQQYPYANVAQGLASLGRGEDTMLMHVTPGELQDFNEMARAAGYEHLPINPHTGLPEFGLGKSFKKAFKSVSKAVSKIASSPIGSAIIPIAAGAILGPWAFGTGGPFAGGIAGLGPAGSTALVGGLATGIATGDPLKGLMAAPGYYGGYNLGNQFGFGGQQIASAGGASNVTPDYLTNYAQTAGPGGIPLESGTALSSSYVPGDLSSHLSNLYEGIGSLVTEPTATFDALRNVGGKFTVQPGEVVNTAELVGQTLPEGYTLAGETTPIVGVTDTGIPIPGDSQTFLQAPDILGVEQAGIFETALPGGSAVFSLGMAGATEEPEPLSQEEIDRLTGQNYDVNREPLNLAGSTDLRFLNNAPDAGIGTSTIAQGPVAGYYTADELKDLYEVSKGVKEGGIIKLYPGGYLRGQGDGMSDGIKANIEGQQEAALSDGEFVLPADVVSHLGNGSSEAGASKLYAMMDRIRKDRTGTTKQGTEIDAYNYMPA